MRSCASLTTANGAGGTFSLAGLAAAFTAANELPALSLLALVGLLLLWHAPRETLVRVRAGRRRRRGRFLRHQLDRPRQSAPPYMHRSETDPSDNWYHYTYTVNGKERQSYWHDRQGIDRGEPTKSTYALHALVGHHGIFSLTPMWLLSVAGMLHVAASAGPHGAASWLRSSR